MPVDEHKLYSTSDAMVWAEEWCKVAREIVAANDGRQLIDRGWMISWFANAIETAKMIESKRVSEDLVRVRALIARALSELGVPGPDYPAPVANAVEILKGAMGIESREHSGQSGG